LNEREKEENLLVYLFFLATTAVAFYCRHHTKAMEISLLLFLEGYLTAKSE
jgi:hypothetical protein